MADWPQLQEGQRYADLGFASATSTGTVSTGGALNTKGSWVQFSASTPFDASALLICAYGGTAGVNHLFDVGIGAAASEFVIVPNVFNRLGSTGGIYVQYALVPVSIPVGTRVAVRNQSDNASNTITLMLYLIGC